MTRNLIVIIGLIISILLLSGCIEIPYRDNGIFEKMGAVKKIKYNVIFGGTFTDWRDELYFEDGDCLWIQGGDLSQIELNKTGVYRFRKNYFDYEGYRYKFHKLLGVEYLN